MPALADAPRRRQGVAMSTVAPFDNPDEFTYPEEMEDPDDVDSRRCDNRFVIYEANMFRKGWDLFLFVALIYTSTVFPFRLAFIDFGFGARAGIPPEEFTTTTINFTTTSVYQSPTTVTTTTSDPGCEIWNGYESCGNPWHVIDEIINTIFWIDLFVNFFFSFREEGANGRGREVGNLVVIVSKYLKTYFLLNLIACLPPQVFSSLLELTVSAGDGGVATGNANQVTRLLRLQRLSRLTRLARLLRLAKLLHLLKKNRIIRQISTMRGVRVFNFIGFLLFGVHLMACFWYLLASVENAGDTDEENTYAQSWVGRRGVCCGMTLLDEPNHWVVWLHAMYFILTVFTTVGFGDMSGGTVGEILYIFLTMIVGAVFHGIIVSEMISVVTAVDKKDEDISRQKDLVMAFSKHTNITKLPVFNELTEWVESSAHIRPRYDRASMKLMLTSSFLPRKLLADLPQRMFGGKFVANKFLGVCKAMEPHLPPRFPLLIALSVNWRWFEAGEIIYFCHDHPFNVFFILSGVCAHIAWPTPSGGVSEWMPNFSSHTNKCIQNAWDKNAKPASTMILDESGSPISVAPMEAPSGSSIAPMDDQTEAQVSPEKSVRTEGKPVLYPYMVHGGPYKTKDTCRDEFPDYHHGDYFGDVELLNNTSRNSSVRCESKGATLLLLPKTDFLDLAEEFPRFGNAWRLNAQRREAMRLALLKKLTKGQSCKTISAVCIQTVWRQRRTRSRRLSQGLKAITLPAERGGNISRQSEETLAALRLASLPEAGELQVQLAARPGAASSLATARGAKSTRRLATGADVTALRAEVMKSHFALKHEVKGKMADLHSMIDDMRAEIATIMTCDL